MTDEFKVDPNDIRGDVFIAEKVPGTSLRSWHNTSHNEVVTMLGDEVLNFDFITEEDFNTRRSVANAADQAAFEARMKAGQ